MPWGVHPMPGFNVRAERFAGYVTFSSDARRDPRACRGIWKICWPAFEALDLGRLPWPWPWDPAAFGEVFVGKQEFEVFAQVWWWMVS